MTTIGNAWLAVLFVPVIPFGEWTVNRGGASSRPEDGSRHVRNPMYVAVIAVLVGQGVIVGSLVLLRYALVVWAIFQAWVLFYEEPKLTARFGSSYDAYRRNVRRWWPRVRPWNG